jgi:hypothetical protein
LEDRETELGILDHDPLAERQDRRFPNQGSDHARTQNQVRRFERSADFDRNDRSGGAHCRRLDWLCELVVDAGAGLNEEHASTELTREVKTVMPTCALVIGRIGARDPERAGERRANED